MMEELNAYDMGLAGIGFTAKAANERIAELEELVRDMARVILLCKIPSVEVDETADRCMERMVELGIEVD